MYKPLTAVEIKQLKDQGCVADDWSRVKVAGNFDPAFVTNARFGGDIRLGVFGSEISDLAIPCRSGIFNASLHNCTIGDGAYIANVGGKIANYDIEAGAFIENIGTLAVTGETEFGNNTAVAVMNEAGSRQVRIYDGISAQSAALSTLFRHRDKMIACMDKIVGDYAAKTSSRRGTIGNNARVTGAGRIINVNIGPGAVVDGALSLANGTVASSVEQPAKVGPGVIAQDFIFASGAVVSDGAKISRCFVGQCATVSRGFSAENCLIFCNSELLNGEACSVFAGPFTVSHHKSTLLLAAMYSFYNAGSGTNKSNHMYRLGPVHQGICQRGSKTGSDSYMLWPAIVGAFSAVSGKHTVHFDTSSMPFSYIVNDSGKSVLVPGTALRSCGTLRDIQKWPKRDRRQPQGRLDMIVFDGLSPYTVGQMITGRTQLKNLRAASRGMNEAIMLGGLEIKPPAVEKGIEYYDLAITTYLGSRLIKQIENARPGDLGALQAAIMPQTTIGRGRWMDLAGLIAPEEVIATVVGEIESGEITELGQLQGRWQSIYDNYHKYQWNFVMGQIEDYCSLPIEKIRPGDLVGLLMEYKFAIERLNILILDDAKKEFDGSMQVSYGYDGEAGIKQADFAAVRGSFDTNEFCQSIRASIAHSLREASSIIELLGRIL